MNTRAWSVIGLVLGLGCLLGSVLVSSAEIVNLFRSSPAPAHLNAKLLAGASIFRICLAVLGLLLIAAYKLPVMSGPGIPNPRPMRGSLLTSAVLGIILIAAFALRLYDLGAGLWHDEITTYTTYLKSMPIGEIASTYISENQHFLFNLSARATILLFGDSSWSVRLPAVLFGTASIWALFLLGRELLSTREALLSAALMTVSYHHIWFSQNARGYTALLFWSLLSSWFLVRALKTSRNLDWVLFAISTALGVYSHITMLFMTAGHLMLFLSAQFKKRGEPLGERSKGFFLGFCLAGFLTILLHAPALPQVLAGVGEVSTVAAWKSPLWTLLEIVRGLRIGLFGAVLIPAAVVFAAGLWNLWSNNSPIVALLLWPIFICAALVVGMGHHLWPRFFFFEMGLLVLVAIRGLVVSCEFLAKFLNIRPERRSYLGVSMAAVTILVSAFSVPFAYGPKQDYQSALRYVQQNRISDDAVVTVGLASYTYHNLYQTDWQTVKTPAQLEMVRSRFKRTWAVYTFPPEAEAVYPELMKRIRTDFTLLKRFPGTLNNGTIYVLRSDSSPVASH